MTPSVRWSCFSSTCSSSRSLRSSAPSGSSSSRMSGLKTMARASATRCCWPPESCEGRRSCRPSSRTSFSASSAWARATAPPILRTPKREQDVLQHRHVREQRVGLEDQADVALLRRRVGDVAAADEDAARGRPVEAGDQRQQRRLARAARSQDGDELALRHRQIDLVGRGNGAVALAHAFEADVAHRSAAMARSAAASVWSMIASSCAVDRNHLPAWLMRMPSSCSARWKASTPSRSQASASR